MHITCSRDGTHVETSASTQTIIVCFLFCAGAFQSRTPVELGFYLPPASKSAATTASVEEKNTQQARSVRSCVCACETAWETVGPDTDQKYMSRVFEIPSTKETT